MSLNNIKIWCCSVTYDQIYNFHQNTNYILKQQQNRRCIPPEFCCILHLIYFEKISFIHSDHFYSASSSPLLLRSNSSMHIWKEINRINQKVVNRPNKDCMTGVKQAINYFSSPIHYVDLKSKEDCFTTVFFFAFPTGLSAPLCRPDFNQVMTYTVLDPSNSMAYH